jgi:predicted DNA-binding WGR domain protein
MSHLNLILRAINLEKNVNRVYQIQVCRGGFNSWLVIINYGRYGGGTRQTIHSFWTLEEAKVFVDKTLKKRSSSMMRIRCNYQLTSKNYSEEFKSLRYI